MMSIHSIWPEMQTKNVPSVIFKTIYNEAKDFQWALIVSVVLGCYGYLNSWDK